MTTNNSQAMTEIDSRKIAKHKIAELCSLGGQVVREAKIVRMEDGRECCVDDFGRTSWITNPNKPEHSGNINKAAATGQHYMLYTIAASDAGERIDHEFVISRLNLTGFGAEIVNRIGCKRQQFQIGGMFNSINRADIRLPLDPFFIMRRMDINIFDFTLIKKAIRLGTGKAEADQDLAEMISTCTRAKLEYGGEAWQRFYSEIKAVCHAELEQLKASK